MRLCRSCIEDEGPSSAHSPTPDIHEVVLSIASSTQVSLLCQQKSTFRRQVDSHRTAHLELSLFESLCEGKLQEQYSRTGCKDTPLHRNIIAWQFFCSEPATSLVIFDIDACFGRSKFRSIVCDSRVTADRLTRSLPLDQAHE